MNETLNKDLNMKINVQKTRVLVRGRENKTIVKIKLRGNQIIDQVDEFTYLGSAISKRWKK